MGVESKTHTVSDVDTYVFRQFGDDSNVQITSADVIRFINIACRQMFEMNPSMNQANGSTNIVANQNVYDLTSDPNFSNVRFIRSVRYQGQVILGFTRQEAEMYLLYNNVLYPAPPAGIPTNWWLDDNGKLYLYPTPMTNVTSGLLIHYNAYPKSVTSTSDSLDVPDSHYSALLAYVMQQIYELDENMQLSNMKKEEFKELMTIFKDRTEVEEDEFPVIRLDPEDSVY